MDGLTPPQENVDSTLTPSPSPETLREEDKKPKGKGWLFGLGCVGCGIAGCLGSVLLVVLLFGGGIFWMMNNIFSQSPLDVPPVTITSAGEAALEGRLEKFQKELNRSPGKDVPISFTIEELNYQFQKTSEKTRLKMHLEDLGNDRIKFILSAPMNQEQQSALFLNMSGEGKVSAANGKFDAQFDKLTIGKINIPEGEFMKGFSQGIAESVEKEEVYQKLPYKIQELKIKDGKIFLKFQMKGTGDASPGASPEDGEKTK
jgi:hypothetical protein